MIIAGLLEVVKILLNVLLMPIHIPLLPASVSDILETGAEYLTDGLGIFAAFCHFEYVGTLFAAALVIDAAMLVYKFVLWVLKKIPMIGVE